MSSKLRNMRFMQRARDAKGSQEEAAPKSNFKSEEEWYLSYQNPIINQTNSVVKYEPYNSFVTAGTSEPAQSTAGRRKFGDFIKSKEESKTDSEDGSESDSEGSKDEQAKSKAAADDRQALKKLSKLSSISGSKRKAPDARNKRKDEENTGSRSVRGSNGFKSSKKSKKSKS